MRLPVKELKTHLSLPWYVFLGTSLAPRTAGGCGFSQSVRQEGVAVVMPEKGPRNNLWP